MKELNYNLKDIFQKQKGKVRFCDKCKIFCKCEGCSVTRGDLKNIKKIYKENSIGIVNETTLLGLIWPASFYSLCYFQSIQVNNTLRILNLVVIPLISGWVSWYLHHKTFKQTVKYWKEL